MPLIGFHCPGEPWSAVTSLDQCASCQSRCLPIELLRLIWKWAIPAEDSTHYHDNPDVVSVTEALGCLRKAFYARTTNYTEEAEKLLPRVTGGVLHKAIEDAQEDDGSEVMLGKKIDSKYSLTGTADRLLDIVKDWKTVGRPKKTYSDHEAMQLNVYRQMSGRESLSMQIVQIGAEKDSEKRRVAVHEVHEIEDALEICMERAKRLIKALEENSVSSLPFDGIGIKFYRACACDFCPFMDVCGPEV